MTNWSGYSLSYSLYNNTLVAFLFAGKDSLSYKVALYGPSLISSFCTLTASWLDRDCYFLSLVDSGHHNMITSD